MSLGQIITVHLCLLCATKTADVFLRSKTRSDLDLFPDTAWKMDKMSEEGDADGMEKSRRARTHTFHPDAWILV